MSVIVPPMDFTSSSVPVQMEFLFAEGCPPLPLDGALTAANSVSPVCRAESVSPAASEEVMGEVIVMSRAEQPDDETTPSAVMLLAAMPVTLADVLARLMIEPCSPDLVYMKSGVRTLGRALRRALSDIPADPALLRELMKDVTCASVGMTGSRWRSVRSLSLRALGRVGINVMPSRDTDAMSPAWRQLADQLPTKTLRLGLSRLMSHCTREGIEPGAVNADILVQFGEALKARSLKADPEKLYRTTVRLWNEAVETVADWPQALVHMDAHPRFYSLPWTKFPESFQVDVNDFLAWSGDPDLFAVDYPKPVKRSTVDLRRRQIRQLASAAVLSGFNIEDLVDLAVLVKSDIGEAALRHLTDRNGGKSSTSIGQQAWLLCTIARLWAKSEKDAATLKVFACRLTVKPKGMVARNRDRLRQFDLQENVANLLHLPGRVLNQVQRRKLGTPQEARRMMLACAVEVLIVAPMRIDNLSGLELDRHLIAVGHGNAPQRHIVIPAHETKTDVPFEMVLPYVSNRLLETYLRIYRDRICPGSSDYLFPNPTGGRRNTSAFSRAISEFIELETGLKMHAHLFRHLAAKLHLNAHPQDIETVRRILNHRTTATTLRAYTEQRTDGAFKRYDQTIADLRGGLDKITRKNLEDGDPK
jgi:integrase